MALTCKLSEIIRQLERGTLPLWILDGMDEDEANFIATLNRGEEYRLEGPDGQVLIIKAAPSPSRSFIARVVEWFRK